jgi:anti-sigma factor RsiW
MMNHENAVQLMAVERYLLDDLTSELRDEFEEHMFDCAECALDLRSGAAFVNEAKLQLPQLIAASHPPQAAAPSRVEPRQAKSSLNWLAWLRPVFAVPAPAFAVPAFAALLGLVAYQNIQTIPSLRASAASPRVVPWTSFHTGTRGGAQLDVAANSSQGAAVLIDLPQEVPYAGYVFNLYDQQGKQFWTQTVLPSSQTAGGTFLLMIPGAGLKQGFYTLVIAGKTAQGDRTEISRRILNFHFDE